MTAIIALALAVFAGFAAQKGSICAVAAVRDLVDGRTRRYLAFIECAAWSLAILTLAAAFGFNPASPPRDFSPGASAAIGGALFGLGAAVNGACTFGSAARLGRGELAFAAMPIGFLAGVAIVSRIFAAPVAHQITTAAPPSVVVTLLVFFVGFQLFRASENIGAPQQMIAKFIKAAWHPSLAMAVIGLSSGLLMIFFAPWPYSSLLVDLGVSATSENLALKIALALFFVAGAALGARTKGALRLTPPTLRAAAEKAAGGALMGAGSFLVPGGNDAMVLIGLPNLFGHAILAYLTMTAAIAATVVIGRWRA